jgi:hypothetical protein
MLCAGGNSFLTCRGVLSRVFSMSGLAPLEHSSLTTSTAEGSDMTKDRVRQHRLLFTGNCLNTSTAA